MASAAEVVDHLTDVDFAAHRDELVRAAEAAGAPEAGVNALRAMPPGVYDNKDEVRRSARTETEPGRDPGVRNAQARQSPHGQVAQHMREV